MVRRLSLALPLMLAIAACAGSPSAPPQADQQAKLFEPPQPAKGALYVYRSGLMGAMRPLALAL